MWEMKASFSRLLLLAIWRRKKDMYYAVSIISIAGNLILLVGPTVKASFLSLTRLLQTIGLLQTAALSSINSFQAALQTVSTAGELQIRSWNPAFLRVVELVLQRSVLCILLNLILARIVFKSGVLGEKRSSQTPFCMRQELFHSLGDFFVCESHWLAPSCFHTVCSTMSNFADVQITGPSMLLQHAHHYHSKSLAITDTSMPIIPVSKDICKHDSQNDPLWQGMKKVPALTAGVDTPPLVPSTPSLFTIEPLDEVVQSMKAQQVPVSEAQTPNRHQLRTVPTKVDLVQEVQTQRRKEMRQGKNGELRRQQKTVQTMKDSHGNVRKEHNMIMAMRHGKISHGCCDWREFDLVREDMGVDDDDNQLSRQEFKNRVDTFIDSFKKNLNMKGKTL